MKKVVFLQSQNTAVVAQLVRVPDCGSVGRRFESDLPPEFESSKRLEDFFVPFSFAIKWEHFRFFQEIF